MLIRHAARQKYDLRDISFIPHVSRTADGSCVIKMGHTHVLCTALFEKDCSGNLAVEYGILPGATHPRSPRERGEIRYETQEIQEAIKQSLSVVVDLEALSGIGLKVDCDVLQAEGSLRAAAISGGFVATALALKKLMPFNLFSRPPLIGQVASLSCGFVKGELILDLDSEEAGQADVIGDFVFNDDGQIINIFLKSQRFPATMAQVNKMAEVVLQEGRSILAAQKAVLETA